MIVAEQLSTLFGSASTIFSPRTAEYRQWHFRKNLCSRLAMTIEILKGRYGLIHYYADVAYNRKQSGRAKTIT